MLDCRRFGALSLSRKKSIVVGSAAKWLDFTRLYDRKTAAVYLALKMCNFHHFEDLC